MPPDQDRERERTSSSDTSATTGDAGASASAAPAGGNAANVQPAGGAPQGGTPAPAAGAPQPSREERIEAAIAADNAVELGAIVTEATEIKALCERLVGSKVRLLETIATGAHAGAWRRPVIATFLANAKAVYGVTRTPDGKRDAIDEAIAQNRAPQLIGSASIDSPDWAAALDDTKYQQLLNLLQLPVTGQTLFDVIWRLYGDGTSRNGDCARLTWRAFYTSRILEPGSLEAYADCVPPTSTNNGSSFIHRWVYEPVAPQDDTMKRLLVGVKPLPQGQVNIANIAFSAQSRGYWKRTSPNPTPDWQPEATSTPNATSYFVAASNSIVIVAGGGGSGAGAVAAGAMTNDTAVGHTWDNTGSAVGGSQEAGAPALTYFLNHARHEIGHAVGNKVFQGMGQKGDDFAKAYGGWTPSGRGAFEAAMWNASGEVTLDFSSTGGAADTKVDALVIRNWLVGLIVDKAQPAGNAITTAPGGLQAKFDIIRASTVGSQKLVTYCTGVFYTSGFDPAKFQDGGYTFPAHDPPDPVHIWCDREDPKGFWTYSKAAYSALRASHGWYSLSSHKEMFAEIYTNKYSGGALPPAIGSNDPAGFFRQLEASQDSALVPEGSRTPPGTPPPGAGGGAGEHGGGSPAGVAPSTPTQPAPGARLG